MFAVPYKRYEKSEYDVPVHNDCKEDENVQKNMWFVLADKG